MRETTIHWMNDEKCADVSTCDPRLIAQIEGNGGKPIAQFGRFTVTIIVKSRNRHRAG